DPGLPLGGMVVADRAVADEGPAPVLAGGRAAPPPDARLTDALEAAARAGGRPLARGPVVSTELFYDPDPGRPARWRPEGLAAGERIESPRADLSAMVTRLCIDHLRSARARRETYVGEWLPEPLRATRRSRTRLLPVRPDRGDRRNERGRRPRASDAGASAR